MTKINDLNRIIEALKQGYQMVRNSTKLLVAGVVIGVVNQACAVHGGPDHTARKVAGAPASASTPVTRPVSAPAVQAFVPAEVPPAAGVERPPGHPMEPVAARIPADADPTLPARQPPASGQAPWTAEKKVQHKSLAPVAGTHPTERELPVVTAQAPSGQSDIPGAARAPISGGARSAAYRDTTDLVAPPISPAPNTPQTATASPGVRGEPVAESPSASLPPAGSEEFAPVFPDEFSGDGGHDPARHANLWTRVRAGFRMDTLDSPLVSRYEDYYAARPDYLKRIMSRGKRYLHFIVEEVEKRGMPLEIALLPMIESAYNPAAYSKAHAAGMWQFIPTTGRHYGLQQNWWYDGRRDVLAATRAALDYLQKLYGDFGDWHLALAAYNWGEGAVARAIERNQRVGLPSDYNSLRMPAETRNYVPKLLAVKNIVAEPEKFGLALDDLPNEPYFIRVAAPGHMDFQRAAQLAGVPVEELKSLNPAFNRPVITPTQGDSLLLPADKAEEFSENLKASEGRLLNWQTYRVDRPERLEAIARRFGTTVSLLQQVNGVAKNGRLKAGSTLLVPGSGSRSTSLDMAAFNPPELLPERRGVHRVGRGDTLHNIASRYGVSVKELMAWNGLRQERVRLGQRIALQPRSPSARHAAKATGKPGRATLAQKSQSRSSASAKVAKGRERSESRKPLAATTKRQQLAQRR